MLNYFTMCIPVVSYLEDGDRFCESIHSFACIWILSCPNWKGEAFKVSHDE